MHVAMIRVASSCKFSVVYSVGEFCSLPFFPFVSNESKFRTFSKMSRMMDTNIQIYIRKSYPKSKTFIIPPYKNRANRIEKKQPSSTDLSKCFFFFPRLLSFLGLSSSDVSNRGGENGTFVSPKGRPGSTPDALAA